MTQTDVPAIPVARAGEHQDVPFHALAQASTQPSLYADRRGTVTWANDAAELALGRALLGHDLEHLFGGAVVHPLREEREVQGRLYVLSSQSVGEGWAVSWEDLTAQRASELVLTEAVADTAAVNAVLSAITSVDNLEEAARIALDRVRSAFGWAYGSYWKVDPSDRALHFVVESGSAGEEFRAITLESSFKEGVGLSGRAWKTRDLFFTRDIGEMTDCVRAPAAQRVGVKSGVCFPVIVDGEVVGTMDFFATETLSPSPQRLDALRNVGNLVSGAFARITAADSQREESADTAAINSVLTVLSGAETVEDAAKAALDQVRSAFGWAYGSYWKVDPSDRALHFVVESGSAGEEFRAITLASSFKEGVGLSGRAWKSRDLFFTRDIGEMTDCVRAPIAQKVGVKSGVCFPVIVDGEVVGTMDFFATETLSPSPQRLDALRNVGRLVSATVTRINEAETLRNKVDQILTVVSEAAQGNLTGEITVAGTDAVGQLGTALSVLLGDLRTRLGQIGENASTLAVSANQLSQVSQNMSQSASDTSVQAGVVMDTSSQVSANVQTVASGAEEMSASIAEISRNTTEAAEVAIGAVRAAQETNETISKLGESSREIGEVVKVITAIAQQTNLLALNATIEAARAGEAGKGFAVVANEVKELAKQTAKATEDISRRIETNQSETKAAVSAISEIGQVIDKIAGLQTLIASAVEEQSATTNEIASNVTEAASGATQISQSIVGVAKAADSTSAGAAETLGSAGELSEMAAQLSALVGHFQV